MTAWLVGLALLPLAAPGELPGDGASEEAVLRLATRHTRLDAPPLAA